MYLLETAIRPEQFKTGELIMHEYPDSALEERVKQIKEAKEHGTKIIGYFPGNYVPEELITASGAIPLCLINGGDTPPLEAVSNIIPGIYCPFARAQIGEKVLNRNPLYSMIDLLVAPVTCQHLRKAADIWEYFGYTEVFKLGIPHQFENDFEVNYFTERLNVLKEKLQYLTGNEITSEKIRKAVGRFNKIRELLKKLSLTRMNLAPALSTLEFIRLNHSSFILDTEETIRILEASLRKINSEVSINENKPRILLMGPIIGLGDYKIFDMVNNAGGNIVAEEFFEGTRNYWNTISENVDPLESLSKAYLADRVPPALMRYSSRKRLDHILKLVSDFKISGIIWYELICCETYDAESYYIAEEMGRRNVPVLILESDYSNIGQGAVKTRIEAFIEMLTGGL